MSQNLQFGYFNLQGRGQVSRLLLAYTKTQYKEITYTFSKISDWLQNDKVNLGLDFPSLPYLIDGKFKLTESKAVQYYIIHRAKKASEMLGKNSKQKALINNIEGVLKDIFNTLIGLFFSTDFQTERKRVFSSIEQKLDYLNQYIGERNHFLNRITYVDFVLTVVFSYAQLFYPHEYSKWDNVMRVAKFINYIPEVVQYYSTSGSISDLIAPQKANDPRFLNIQPVHQKQKQQKQVQIAKIPETQNKIEQSSQNLQEEVFTSQKHQDKQIQTRHQEKIEVEPLATIKKTQSSVQQTATDKQSMNQRSHFNSRVHEYQKAAEATNNVEFSQIKVDMQKSLIVTPSKIGSVKSNENFQASWKIFTQAKKNSQPLTKKSKIILGYWGIRGLGQIQRHLLAYCGHDFTQDIYKTREEWVNTSKQGLGLAFPNLPYLIQGDFKLTESLAIDRYIIRTSEKHELLGKNLIDETLIENIVKILSELFKDIRVFCFTTEQIEQKKAKLHIRIDNDFKRMNDFIQNKQFAFGYLSWADFYIAQVSYYIHKIFPQIFEKYQFLKNIQQSVQKVSNVQKYYQRDISIKGPFMPPSAKIFF